jgi:hypothetical protein
MGWAYNQRSSHPNFNHGIAVTRNYGHGPLWWASIISSAPEGVPPWLAWRIVHRAVPAYIHLSARPSDGQAGWAVADQPDPHAAVSLAGWHGPGPGGYVYFPTFMHHERLEAS